jgi:hypothetical protein
MHDRIRITPIARNIHQPMRLEIWGASRKARLLEKVAGTPVEIVQPRLAARTRDGVITDRAVRSPT